MGERKYIMPPDGEIIEYAPKVLKSVTAKKSEVVEALEVLLSDELPFDDKMINITSVDEELNEFTTSNQKISNETSSHLSLVEKAKLFRKRIDELEAYYERDTLNNSN